MFPVINKRETGINLRKIMDKCGFTPKDVQEYLGLGCVQSVYRWFDGINMPTIDNLYALSELFGIPIDAIVRGNRAPVTWGVITNQTENTKRRLQSYCEKLCDKKAA